MYYKKGRTTPKMHIKSYIEVHNILSYQLLSVLLWCIAYVLLEHAYEV